MSTKWRICLRWRPVWVGLLAAVWAFCGAKVCVADSPASGAAILTAAVVQDEAAARQDRAAVISAMALSPSGALLATCGDDHLLRIWDAKSLRLLSRGEGHSDWVRAVVFAPLGDSVITAGQDGRILFWEILAGREGFILERPVGLDRWEEAIFHLAVCPAGGHLAAAGFEGKLIVYDLETKKPLASLQSPGRDLRAAKFSPNGEVLAAAGGSGIIRLWKSSTWEILGDLRGQRGRVRTLAFSPDSARLASAGDDGQVMIWDWHTKTLLHQLPHGVPIASMCWCGSDRLAIGRSDNSIQIVELPQANIVARLVGHTGTVSCLLWQADNNQLLSGSFDTTLRIWSLQSVESIAMNPR